MQIISWFWTLDYESSRVRPMSFLDLHKALCPNVTIQAKERYLEKSKTGNCKQTTGPRARMSNTPEAKHVSVSESAPTLNGRISRTNGETFSLQMFMSTSAEKSSLPSEGRSVVQV